MKNISELSHCYGCSLCAVICPQQIITLCQDLTLEEIGEKFGLTRERVRQIKEKAIRRLRHSSRSTLLKTYLG